MKLLIPVFCLSLLAPAGWAAPLQDAQGSGPAPAQPAQQTRRAPLNPAGSQAPGVPIDDISSHRVNPIPYVRRMDQIVSLDELLAQADLSADPILMIGQKPFTQADFRRRALMYLGISEVEQTITQLITLAEIDRRVVQGENADDYLPSDQDVERKINEIKDLVRMNAEQQVGQRGDVDAGDESSEVGDKAVAEFLKSIDSSVGQEKYREMLGAEAAFEKVFLPIPEEATGDEVWDLAKGPVPEDDPRPDWLPAITWKALEIDESGKTLRQFVKGAGSRGEDIPAFFKGQVLTRIRAGVVQSVGVEYFFDNSDLPEGVFMRLGEKGVATAEQDVIDATAWIEGSKVALQEAEAALADAQASLATAQAAAAAMPPSATPVGGDDADDADGADGADGGDDGDDGDDQADTDDAPSAEEAAVDSAEDALAAAREAVEKAKTAVETAPAELEAAVAAVPAARAIVKDITVDELWHLVSATLSDADHEIILREALTLEAMGRTLRQAGRWLDDEAFKAAYAEHEAVYAGTLFPLSAIIMFRGYSSLDRYREHFRYRESYRRWRKDTLTDEDVEDHYREGGRLFFERGSVHVDMAYKGVSTQPFTMMSLNGARDELTAAFSRLGTMVGEGEDSHPMTFDDLLAEFPKPTVQNPQGDDRAFQRNPLRLRMTESDLSIFLTGYSMADDVFYHGVPGEYFGPYVQKCRRHAWGAELNAGAWIVKVDKYSRSRPLAPLEGLNRDQAEEDFLDLNYLYWSQECLESLLDRVTVSS